MFFEPFGASEASNEDVAAVFYIESMVSAVLMESGPMIQYMEEDRLSSLLTREVMNLFGERIAMSPLAGVLTDEAIGLHIEQHRKQLSEYIRVNRQAIEEEQLVVAPTDTLRNWKDWSRFPDISDGVDFSHKSV